MQYGSFAILACWLILFFVKGPVRGALVCAGLSVVFAVFATWKTMQVPDANVEPRMMVATWATIFVLSFGLFFQAGSQLSLKICLRMPTT